MEYNKKELINAIDKLTDNTEYAERIQKSIEDCYTCDMFINYPQLKTATNKIFETVNNIECKEFVKQLIDVMEIETDIIEVKRMKENMRITDLELYTDVINCVIRLTSDA